MAAWQRPDILPDLRRVGLISLDAETNDQRLQAGLGAGWATGESRIVGVSVAHRVESEIRSYYFPINHPDSSNFGREQVFAWIKDHIASDVRFVTQNGLYDWGGLRADAGIIMPSSGRLEEIGALATMIDENRFYYRLDSLCEWRGLEGKNETTLRNEIEARFGVKCSKRGKNKPQAFIWQLPAQIVGPYAETDAAQTLALFESLYPILEQEDTGKAYRLEVDLLPMVLEMRWRGIRVDVAAAERNRDLLLQKRDAVFVELAEKLGVVAVDIEDIGNTKWLAEKCDRLGIKYPYTNTGKPSFTAGTLGWMHRSEHWFPQLVVKADKYNKAATDFLQRHILDHVVSGRIHAEIHPHRSEDGGTRSTRFSYSHPPLQQMVSHDEEITPLVRGVFLPEEGETWATADYSQQEFRLLVHEAAQRKLSSADKALDRYQRDPNTDFHNLVAEIAGLERQTAKHANFAKTYRAGPAKFAATIGKSEAEAIAIMDRYDRELPFVLALAVDCQRQAEKAGYLQLYDGTRRHFNEWEAAYVPWGPGTGPCDIEEARRRARDPQHPWCGCRLQRAGAYFAVNSLIQGNAARQAKLWMRACWQEGIVPLLMMHDGLELSVSSPEQAERVAQLGCDVIALSVPMRVEVTYGRTWADAKHAWADIPAPAAVDIAAPYQPPPPVPATQRVSATLLTPRVQDFVNLEKFITFVHARHAVYLKRQAGLPPPWTDDPILRDWSFCNMYRSLDKTSVWIWQNWIEPHANDRDLWFGMLVARLVNRIETLATLGYPVPWSPEHFIEVMERRGKGKGYGNAYVIPAFKGDERPKYVSQVERVFNPMWENRELLRPCPGMTLALFTQNLRTYPGLGEGFLVAQVVADTKRVEPLLSAPDFQTFALSGPGSRIGMNFVLGRKAEASWRKNDRDWYQRLAELHALITPRYVTLDLPVPDYQDLQNQLCEFAKYFALSTGLRTMLKRAYKPAPTPRAPKAAKTRTRKPKPGAEPSQSASVIAVMAASEAADTACMTMVSSPPLAPAAEIIPFKTPPKSSSSGDDHRSRRSSATGSPHGNAGPPRGEKKASWIYDSLDQELYLLVEKRIAANGDRNFYQYHWTGARWDPQIKGTYAERKVPYQFRALKAALAVDPNVLVNVTEGEKDADTLRRLGFVATTNPGGANQWTDDLTAWLRVLGVRRVVVHEDNDKAGRKRTATLAAALSRFATVRVVQYLDAPEGEDITYWIDELHHSKANLEARIAAAKPATDAIAIQPEAAFISGWQPPDYLIEGVLQRRFIYALTGQTGHAKTAIALRLAKTVDAPGSTLASHQVDQGRGAYLVGENPDDVRARVIGENAITGQTAGNILFVPGVFDTDALLEKAAELGNLDLLIVDTSAAYFLGDEENSNTEMGEHARKLRRLLDLPGGPCVLVLCHPTKYASEPAQLLPRGGGAFLAEIDGNLTVWKEEDHLAILHHSDKIRGPGFEPITFRLETIRVEQLHDSKGRLIPTVRAVAISDADETAEVETARSDEDALLIARLHGPPDMSMTDLAIALDWISASGQKLKSKVQRVLYRLAKEKLVKLERKRWVLSDKGKQAAKAAEGRAKEGT
jgi:DNA polymerase I-like protein with 3'-5' exonuclease and polymerase domains